jgi:Cu+-exporting ATPase
MAEPTEVVQLPVQGMTCNHCVGTVQQALERVPGVQSASVDLAHGRAEVTLDPTKADRARLRSAVEAAGYRVPEDGDGASPPPERPAPRLVTLGNGPMHVLAPSPALAPVQAPNPARTAVEVKDAPGEEEWNLAIGGMHCASCVARVEGALSGVPGVSEARVNLATERASVVVGRGRVREEQLAEAVARAGYSARRSELELGAGAESLRRERGENVAYWRNRLIVGVLLVIPLLVLGYGPLLFPSAFGAAAWVGWAMFALATVMQVYLGGPYLRGAWMRLKQGTANMDTLIALGTSTAYGYSVAQLLLGHAHEAHYSMEVVAFVFGAILIGLLALICVGPYFLRSKDSIKVPPGQNKYRT